MEDISILKNATRFMEVTKHCVKKVCKYDFLIGPSLHIEALNLSLIEMNRWLEK